MGDDQIPVLVGADQLTQREVEFEQALSPLEMLERVARGAAEDSSQSSALLAELDTIGLVEVLGWRPKNGPRLLAESLGADKVEHEFDCHIGGETPIVLLNQFAERIRAGESRVALVAGCNNFKTLKRAHKLSADLNWPTGGSGKPKMIGDNRPGSSELEMKYGLVLPPHIYPIFENALRFKRGLGLEEHGRRVGALFSSFTRVAAANPHAWYPLERSAEELTTATDQNRMVAFPYTKYLNAVLETDQAAGVILMSQAAARSLEIPQDRWVYWCGGGGAHERAWFPSQRSDFSRCSAIQKSHLGALAESGVELAQIDHFDLYSCFPSAVSMVCEMLGLAEDDPRGFTVTGGLPYAGGPGNAYSIHAVAAMMETLRAEAGSKGMVTGNGWYLTKHAATILSSAPPEPGNVYDPPRLEPNDEVPVMLLEEAEGDAVVETYTVLFDRDGTPVRGIVIGRLGNGLRFIANTPQDRGLMDSILAHEFIGVRGRVAHMDGSNLFSPEG